MLSQGGSPTYYSLGGINQLRGFGFREYFGSRVAWSNLELRYPLVDEMRFPFLAIRSIRGFLFLDVGAAWFENGGFYDPALGTVRVSRETGAVIPFKFWDSDNNRLQDGRASFGAGFQFLFMGGLQFNWSWAWIRPYTQYLPRDPTDFGSPLVRHGQRAALQHLQRPNIFPRCRTRRNEDVNPRRTCFALGTPPEGRPHG